MQRLTSAAPIDDFTLATYEETVAIIRRHLPPSLALLYATARRSPEGNLEWWTARQGLARPLSALNEAEQIAILSKRQKYQDIILGLIDQLAAHGEDKSAQALQMLLSNSRELACYGVGGEPVLVNWAIASDSLPPLVASIPWWRSFLPWLLLALFLLLLALVCWWYKHNAYSHSDIPKQSEVPTQKEILIQKKVPTSVASKPIPPARTQLTEDNPSIQLTRRKDFGRIKVNLTWQQGNHQRPVDLDIAAFIRFKNGNKGGVEALSKYLGDYDKLPYMVLQKDLRDGDNQDGEWLFINGSHWQDIDEVLIYSFIYGGANNWQGTDATITIYVPNQPPITSTLVDGNNLNNVAVIARLKNINGDIQVERLNSFFRDRESVDKNYGWGFEWTPGASKN